MSSRVICAICQEPIESRKELALKGSLYKFEIEPVHYKCHIDEQIQSGQHWNMFDSRILNSLSNKIVPLIALMAIGAIAFFDQTPSTLIALGGVGIYCTVTLFFLLVAHFKYERKLPLEPPEQKQLPDEPQKLSQHSPGDQGGMN